MFQTNKDSSLLALKSDTYCLGGFVRQVSQQRGLQPKGSLSAREVWTDSKRRDADPKRKTSERAVMMVVA